MRLSPALGAYNGKNKMHLNFLLTHMEGKFVLDTEMPIPHWNVKNDTGVIFFAYFLQCVDLPEQVSISFQNRTHTFLSKKEREDFTKGFCFSCELFNEAACQQAVIVE